MFAWQIALRRIYGMLNNERRFARNDLFGSAGLLEKRLATAGAAGADLFRITSQERAAMAATRHGAHSLARCMMRVIKQLIMAPITAATMPVMASGRPFSRGSFSMRRMAARPSPKAAICGSTEAKPTAEAPICTAMADIKKPTNPPVMARMGEKRASKDSAAG